ncbi:MAG: UDP-N-acetylmuramate--L-alanine ligase [Ruminococcus sp.]|nr:UDP-N-acetylmuramate--L-alanine ligase [Ruminococcus sp.]
MKKELKDYQNIHLIGIGGASMYSIAAMLKNDGKNITGSDLALSQNVEYLKNLGINITIGHNPDIVKNADLVIYTAAISDDDIELTTAKENNIECVERAVFLGIYTKDYENLICISGTHGKSTTTSMVASIFLEANLNPTIQVGAHLKKINGNYCIGDKKYFILEACEYVDSFLHFHPTHEIVLNIDNDHLDYFKTIENTKKSFQKYVDLLPTNGYLIKNIDDDNTKDLNTKNTITYGIKNKDATLQARNITYQELGFPTFDVYFHNEYYDTINLSVLGNHNVLNSLAAIAISLIYNIDKNYVKNALKEFTGVGRRFEYLGNFNNISIFDDFAHHPTEIMTTYNSSKSIKHHETWAVFQSHTFSRTHELLNDFANVLSNFDHIIICDIYPAREIDEWGNLEEQLVNLINEKNKNVIHIKTYEEIALYLKDSIKENDLIITIGAGPINKVANILLEKNLK